MRKMRLAGVAFVLLLSVAGAVGARTPAAPAKHCKAGTTSATIAGKHACLKPGARCTKRNDRAYHRYRFHCHSGRLTRFPAPAPQPAPPPTLAEPPAPAGGLIDVGGYRLHLECVGTGSPTVVIEAGAMATRLGYRKVQYALSAEYRVCSYDRPGTFVPSPSASDPRPPSVPPTSETFARELQTLLARAQVPGPYVLAGASFAGLLVSTFALRYPDQVAGLVFLDADGPGSADSWARLGGGAPEGWDVRADSAALTAVSFGSRPVVVLTTTLPGPIPDLRRRGTSVVVAEAPQYGHFIGVEAPGLAYEAIRVAAAAVRAGGPLAPCAQTPLARLVRRCSP
jgi:pimeloyl-ACP methyl ester carboxylesterase